MLVATRDPLPQSGAPEAPRAGLGRPAGSVTRVARFMTMLQLAGSLLAIPVGLASAYSIYRANFSVETSCQSLRAGIIGMIDKQIDAGTRRILVGRDVESFEKTCAAVDPDAVAAFKKLLEIEKAPSVARAAAPAKEAPAKEAVRKLELRPSVTAKPTAVPVPPPAPATAIAEPAASAAHEARVSDAKWLAAVRGALVAQPAAHERTTAPAASAAEPAVTASLRAPAPVPRAAELAPVASVPVPAEAPVAAPALPPPAAIASVPAQSPAGDHPVPPAGIPQTMASATVHSGSWIGKIPFVGQMLAR